MHVPSLWPEYQASCWAAASHRQDGHPHKHSFTSKPCLNVKAPLSSFTSVSVAQSILGKGPGVGSFFLVTKSSWNISKQWQIFKPKAKHNSQHSSGGNVLGHPSNVLKVQIQDTCIYEYFLFVVPRSESLKCNLQYNDLKTLVTDLNYLYNTHHRVS